MRHYKQYFMRKYIYTILTVIVSLFVIACNEDETVMEVPSAPRMTAITPEDGATNVVAQDGMLTIELVYDQKIKLSEDNPTSCILI